MEQQKELEREISTRLDRLLAIVAKCDTESVVGWCIGYYLTTSSSEIGSEERLLSPAKQIPFLISVLLSTPDPAEAQPMSAEQWKEVKSALDHLFRAYMRLYMPSREQVGALSEEWLRSREVSMGAFLHFFNTGLLASVEQISGRIQKYLVPFDDEIQKLLGISAGNALAVSRWIAETLQGDIDRLQRVAAEELKARESMLDRARQEGWDLTRLREAAKSSTYLDAAKSMLEGLHKVGKFSARALQVAFPQTGPPFLAAFTMKRGETPPLRYPTETSVFLTKPLVRISEDDVMCLTANAIAEAVLTACEKALITSPVRDAYLRARDKALEQECVEHIRTFLDPGVQVYSSVFESPDSQFEHDLIIDDPILQIALEAKASPPNEPFRDPDKAFPRLRDAFRGDTGIQKAFSQGNRIVRKLKDNTVIPLYDSKGTQVTELKPDPAKLPVCICVTRDNFGLIATKLSLLLEKEEADAYPWAVNILDLSNLAMAWKYLKWGSKEFRLYLEQRAQLHKKGLADDELDFAGYFIRHGSFKAALEAKADMFHFNPNYSSVFDDLYRHIHLGGPPVEIEQTTPVVMDLRKSLRRDSPVFLDPTTFEVLESEESRDNDLRSRGKKRKEKMKERMKKKSRARNRKKKP